MHRGTNKWTGAANNLLCQAASASATPPHFFCYTTTTTYQNQSRLLIGTRSMIDRTIKEMCSFSSHTSIATNGGTILSLQSSSHHIRIATRLATSFTLYHRTGSSSSISIVHRRPTDWLYVSINLKPLRKIIICPCFLHVSCASQLLRVLDIIHFLVRKKVKGTSSSCHMENT